MDKKITTHPFTPSMSYPDGEGCALIVEGHTWTAIDPVRCRKSRAEHERSLFKVAVIDGEGDNAEIDLHLVDSDGEFHSEFPWPSDWPSWVSVAFLRDRGFRVISA
jgi:hypothetical protein